MDVKAKLNHLKLSPKKVRLVANLIKGLPVDAAVSQLIYINKQAARPLLKLLRSALANAENNFQLKKDNLLIKHITVDQGPVLKRWRPRAFGRATMLRKPSCHINLLLSEIESVAGKQVSTELPKQSVVKKQVKFTEVKRRSRLSLAAKDRADGKHTTDAHVAPERITIRQGED